MNGQLLVIEMAVRKLDDPLLTRWRRALILGALREDVYYVPVLRFVFEHLALSHFHGPNLPGGFVPFLWPGARWKANKFYDRAVARYRKGQVPAAFLELGRACHLLTDMACPVHVHRVIHETDPYEWYVEGHLERLSGLDFPSVPPARRPSELVAALARYTVQFAPDRTNNAIGRWMLRRGHYKQLPRRTLAEQAEKLIPMAAGHAVGLLQLFLREVGARP